MDRVMCSEPVGLWRTAALLRGENLRQRLEHNSLPLPNTSEKQP